MQKSKNAFTMIELIFVIVVLGILAAVALPKFASTKRQADIASGRADVATVRSAIVNERQTQIVKGKNSWIPKLSDNSTSLFTGDGDRRLLMYAIKAGSSTDGWTVDNTFLVYQYGVNGTKTQFTYNPDNGTFTCSTTSQSAEQNALCKNLIN